MPFFVLVDFNQHKCTKQSSDSPHDDPSCSSQQALETLENKEDDENWSAPVNRGSAPDAHADLEKLGSELGGDDEGHTTEDIGEWEWIQWTWKGKKRQAEWINSLCTQK